MINIFAALKPELAMLLEAFIFVSNPHTHEPSQLDNQDYLLQVWQVWLGPYSPYSEFHFRFLPWKLFYAWLGHLHHWTFTILNLSQWIFQVLGSELHKIFTLPLNLKSTPPTFHKQRLTTFMIHLVTLPPRIQTASYPLLFYYKRNTMCFMGRGNTWLLGLRRFEIAIVLGCNPVLFVAC